MADLPLRMSQMDLVESGYRKTTNRAPGKGRGLEERTTKESACLRFGAVEDRFRPVRNFEVRRNGEQRGIGFGADEVGKAERSLPHPRIGTLAVDDGFKVRRGPHLGN